MPYKLEVNDNGPGIPQFIIEKGAEMFTKGKDYNDKSTGIGLPLSKLIMEAHRGLLEFKNKKEGGTIVTLSFRLN